MFRVVIRRPLAHDIFTIDRYGRDIIIHGIRDELLAQLLVNKLIRYSSNLVIVYSLPGKPPERGLTNRIASRARPDIAFTSNNTIVCAYYEKPNILICDDIDETMLSRVEECLKSLNGGNDNSPIV